jgi:hypothetical protein
VETLRDSNLYLQFVIGELDPELLHTAPERHVRCNPVLAQFIDHPEFSPVAVAGPFALDHLDQSYVQARRRLVSEGFRRLLEIEATGGDRDVTAYPLPAAVDRYRAK